jgi:hypothetical protein
MLQRLKKQVALDHVGATVKASVAARLTLTSIFASSSRRNHFLTVMRLSSCRQTSGLVASFVNLDCTASSKIRDTALEARAHILEAFSTSTPFGEAISYFATARVSLKYCLDARRDTPRSKISSKLPQKSMQWTMHPISDGKWHGILQKATESPVLKLVFERLGDFENLQIDMRTVLLRSWSDEEYAPIHASAAAISLLQTWAMEAEDFLLTQVVPKDFLASASPYRLLTSSATMPPVVRSDAKLAHILAIMRIQHL